MSIELKIPALGESIQEVQIGRWLKREGESVAEDENVVELETDKASMELPAPAQGVLSKILKHEGNSVAIGETIAVFDQDGGSGEKTKQQKPEEPNTTKTSPEVPASPAAAPVAATATEPPQEAAAPSPTE